jgi:hypothetical protein
LETVFSVGADQGLYNEDLRPAETEQREPLETTVEDDREERVRKELGCEEKTSCVLQSQ